MKKFKITVNGKAYEVEVEEMGGTPVAAPAPQASAPAPAPAAPAPGFGGRTDISWTGPRSTSGRCRPT